MNAAITVIILVPSLPLVSRNISVGSPQLVRLDRDGKLEGVIFRRLFTQNTPVQLERNTTMYKRKRLIMFDEIY